MVKRIACLVTLIYPLILFPQRHSYINGQISDAITGNPLTGATIIIDSSVSVVSDKTGNYELIANPGKYSMKVQFLGYKPSEFKVNLLPGDTVVLNIDLLSDVHMLEEVVVSANKYEQKLSDIIVSMELIKPDKITRTNTISLESIINQTPGIDVLDGQPRIRGGSGYSYGAGSRVLVLVDDLPIISPDASDVKWEFLPVENISQVEIIKGASSVLYGSSALNGVINLRTAFPTVKPTTKISLFNGFYLNPKRKEMIWWDKQPMHSGVSILHTRKIEKLDVVAGANLFNNTGFRENEWDKWARANANFRYRSKRISGLSFGAGFNTMYQNKIDFFLWQDADSGAYRQNIDAITELQGFRLNIDPYIEYFNDKGCKHSIKARYFTVDNEFKKSPDKNNESVLYFAEYKFHKKYHDLLDLSLGTSGSYSVITSEIYDDHNNFAGSFFTQLDGRVIEKLKLSAGVRFELYKLDDEEEYSEPVFRTGANYQVGKFSFLRASFGQGYRFPSIAEKYTSTNLSTVNIFPNPNLISEKGWSAELGLKQGMVFKDWNGYLDVALFRTRYEDMIEYTFGIYLSGISDSITADDVGFKALNIGNAQISGIDLSLAGEGIILNIPVSLLAGYTYIVPIDLDFSSMGGLNSPDEEILKYRSKHSAKADIQITWKKLSTGISFIYNSFMINVDDVFTSPTVGEQILPGYAAYRIKNNKGNIRFDHRISYKITKLLEVAFITKNVFNKEYIGRPGDIGPPRTIAAQLTGTF